MQLTQTLEELLDLFGAKIIRIEYGVSFEVRTHKMLPSSVTAIAQTIDSTGSIELDIFSMSPSNYSEFTYTYTFKDDAKEPLRALLFLASEKERYVAFCKHTDDEIEQELDSSQKEV